MVQLFLIGQIFAKLNLDWNFPYQMADLLRKFLGKKILQLFPRTKLEEHFFSCVWYLAHNQGFNPEIQQSGLKNTAFDLLKAMDEVSEN